MACAEEYIYEWVESSVLVNGDQTDWFSLFMGVRQARMHSIIKIINTFQYLLMDLLGD